MTMKLKVTLNGENYELDYKSGYTILSILRRHKLNPPYSCSQGRCGKCKAKLISGTVNQDFGSGLGLEDRKQNYILTCCSRGESEQIELDFE